MRLLFAGTPDVALPSFEAVLASGHDVVAVLTRPDAPSGRGRKLHPSPVAERAEAEGLDVLKPGSTRDPEFLEQLRGLAPECCAVVAYGGLLPAAVLDVPPHGWINLHFSVLPAWRGAAPVQHAIRSGDTLTGATTFRIVEELDAGPTYGVVTEPIGPTDTAGDLLERLSHSGARLLVETLDGIAAGTLEPRPQPSEDVTYASKVGVDDVRIDWSRPAFAIDRLVRSGTPTPGAWTTFRDERLKVGPVTVVTEAVEVPPGEIVAEKSRVLVGTGSVPVALGEVQPHGKRPMAADAWARGVHPQPAERLG
ncbi:methionyl-tRNA formyltransferase [Actinopolymorpha sp. B11F2]|uniref:methionyl-tRNA formyltransferase n=1 Tax=Actinopolymorpha sp. B11F2 TaxID=3160862 RepID=UPI0032E4DEC5